MSVFFVGNKGLFDDKIDVIDCTLEQAKLLFSGKRMLGIDIETTGRFNKYDKEGLDPYLGKPIMVQVGDKYDQVVIDTRVVDPTPLLKMLKEQDTHLIGHNLKFEYKFIKHHYGIELINLYDTMIAEMVIYNGLNKAMSLKALALRYLTLEIEKSTRNEFENIKSKPFTYAQIVYGAKDVEYPIRIRDKQLYKIRKRDVNKCIRLEMKFIPVLGDIELKGMAFDKDRWMKLFEDNLHLYSIYKDKLDEFIINEPRTKKFIDKQLDLFDSTPKCKVQWTSSKQVVEVLKFLKICPLEKSKTTGMMSYSANAKALKSKLQVLKAQGTLSPRIEEFANNYIKFKEYEQLTTTFGEDFLKYVHPITNRVHSSYKQIISTGRMSSTNPNLQNIPSDPRFRRCFRVNDEKRIVNADYSGQEQIILANKSKEPNLIDFYKSGESDMHSYIARLIFPSIPNTLPLHKVKQDFPEERQIAKAAGFAINYGGNGHTIAKNLGVDVSVGENVYDSYFKSFPELDKYFTKVKRAAINNKHILIDEVTGRKFYYVTSDINKIGRLSMNYPIQGEAGSMTKLAAMLYREEMKKKNKYEEAPITNIVHDEINVEAEDSEIAGQAADVLKFAMEKAANIWCKTVPMTANPAIGAYWAH